MLGTVPVSRVLNSLPERARVAVIRLRSLGDCVLTTPALEILRQSRPDLRVAVVVEDRFAPVFEQNPAVESLLTGAFGAPVNVRLDLDGSQRVVLAFRDL